MKIRFFISTFLLLTTASLTAQLMQESDLSKTNQTVAVNNRVLFNVNNKPISVLDLKKKMDMVLFKQFPQYKDSSVHQYQFYTTNWLNVLVQSIDRELVIADAKEKKLPISDSDIREELQELFGINYLEVIDDLNLSSEEAWALAEEELTVERMMLYSVKFNARDSVTPEEISKAYESYCLSKSSDSEFSYRILTFRNSNPELAHSNAETAYNLLTKSNTPIDQLEEKLKENNQLDVNRKLSISNRYTQKQNELSSSYFLALENLKPGSFSLPKEQHSQQSQEAVYRIFYLINQKKPKVEPLKVVEAMIKDQLLQEAIAQKTETYILKLRDHFHITEEEIKHSFPENFTPFFLN